jgi:hypothetical protein
MVDTDDGFNVRRVIRYIVPIAAPIPTGRGVLTNLAIRAKTDVRRSRPTR